MRPATKRALGTILAAAGLLTASVLSGSSRGDDPGPLGRLFRLGSTSPSSKSSDASRAAGRGSAMSTPGAASPGSGNTGSSSGTAGQRLVPQPRVTRAVTESDPILTRVAIGRSDDGKQFGMCLQVYADGTVLDSEGVHHVGPDVLRPIVHAIQAADTSRLRGHCGGPPTDFIEQVHLVVYERSYGKLRANSFSYSGNPQGCDATVRQLHAAVEALQTKISGPPPTAPAPSSLGAPASGLPAPIPLTNP
jgi:hypothetical protein